MQGTKFGCTMKSEKGSRKDANTEASDRVLGNRDSKSGKRMHVCVWCVGGTQHTQKNGKRLISVPRETALGSPPCGHRAHTYTHTPFPQRPGTTWTSPSLFLGSSLWSLEPQYPPPDHPGGAGSKTIGRKPITHTKLLFFPSFYVCCVPPTYDTHTCIRFPLLLSRLPCTTSTLVRVCVFPISIFRFHGAQNFGTLRLNFPD